VTTSDPLQELQAAGPPNEQATTTTWRDTVAFIRNNGTAMLWAYWGLRSAQLSSRVRLWGRIHVENRGVLQIGSRTRLVSTITPIELVVGSGARLTIGERVFINYGTSIGATLSVEIGDRVNIGSYVIILDNNLHCIEPERRLELPPSEPVIIEENVWLGSRVTVLPGVRIGAHSVVGAGSVVVKDIPPRTLAAGVPARVIRQI
jgi:acetyltransferase-like isoleucine patch superfamily enzyme